MGVGAYGKVMECTYTPQFKSFAVKRFESVFSNDQRGTRLLRELKILSKVDHTCLNRLVSVFPPQGEIKDAYLVLEKCDMDMKKLLKSNKFLEEVQCKSIIYDILCGVNYLHQAHICHRDLKPENVLVNDDCTI
jgi:serine/threonine protein kinase